jgi:hypothetical protein
LPDSRVDCGDFLPPFGPEFDLEGTWLALPITMVRASLLLFILGGIVVYPQTGYPHEALVAKPSQSLAFRAAPIRAVSVGTIPVKATGIAPKGAAGVPGLPGAPPAPLALTNPATAPGMTQFPHLIPYPNIGANTQPATAAQTIQNIQSLPPNSMMTNQNQSDNSSTQMLQQLMSGLGGGANGSSGKSTSDGGDDDDSGGGGGGGGGGIAGAGPGSSLGSGSGNYGKGDQGDYSGHGAGKCNPPVRPEYAQEFAAQAPSDDINKVTHYGCNHKSNDRLVCMVCNIYFEADPGDGDFGHEAVGRSVLTRTVSSPYPDNVCDVVYQHTARVAQYSWIFEHPSWNPTHTLPGPNDARLQKVFRTAVQAFKDGPNGFTNYFAINAMKNHEPPSWANGGSCGAGLCVIQHHTFCPVHAVQDRSYSHYASAEHLSGGGRQVASESGASK